MKHRMYPAMQCENRLRALLTTSWDDGHPLDLRLAELLHKYGIPATFYIPQKHILPVMDASSIRQLATEYEIGGHTLNHANLLFLDDKRARQEIAQCRVALQDATGRECRSFCFPGGYFRRRHLRYLREAGYSAARTVEMLSTARPAQIEGISLLSTTVLAYALPCSAIMRNVIKRVAFANGLNYWHFRRTHWTDMARALLDDVAVTGGVFHLWGHSWEIEQGHAWAEVESMFAAISERRHSFRMATNGELCALTGASTGSMEGDRCPNQQCGA